MENNPTELLPKMSSSMLPFQKTIFPAIWFGFLAFANVVNLKNWNFMVPIVSVLMALAGFWFMKNMVWDLADEVRDGGDYLLVRFRKTAEQVQLSNIMNVSVTLFVNPPRITLRLRNAGKFGSEIAFMPEVTSYLNPFAKNAIAEDLIARVERARSQRGTQ